MNNQIEIDIQKVAKFLEESYDAIVGLTEVRLILRGYRIIESENEGFELIYYLHHKNQCQNVIHFNFGNMLIDVVTVDRNAVCPIFDSKLDDSNYRFEKILSILNARIEAIEMITEIGDLTKLNEKENDDE